MSRRRKNSKVYIDTRQILNGTLPAAAIGPHTHAAGDVNSGTFADGRIAESNVTQHEAALSILESQISDLQSYSLPGDNVSSFTNDSGYITSASVPVDSVAGKTGVVVLAASDIASGTFADARISQTSVTQHEAALSILESQISDLGNYALVGANISTFTNDSGYITSAPVASVAGKTGTVVLAAGDIASGTFTDARISSSSVTQHEAALTITESQISDLGSYYSAGDTILAGAGTELLPSLSFSGDPDTGVWNPSANVMAFSAGGSEIIRVGSGGLSVGTTASDGTFHYASNGNAGNNFLIQESDATLNEGLYEMQAQSRNFSIRAVNDAISVATPIFRWKRKAYDAITNPNGIALEEMTLANNSVYIDENQNVNLGSTASPASAAKALILNNGTAPTGGVTNGVVLFAEDVSSSSELKVRDEAGNETTLSPHNFSKIPGGRSEEMAFSYYSQRGNKVVNVDLLKVVRAVEQLTGEQLAYIVDLSPEEQRATPNSRPRVYDVDPNKLGLFPGPRKEQ